MRRTVGNSMRYLLAEIALAGLAISARAQTIQLPSFHSFSVDTTVLVPDSGTGFVAGDKRGATGSNQFGPLRGQRASGWERSSAGVAVHAQIHDPQAADDALLGRVATGQVAVPSGARAAASNAAAATARIAAGSSPALGSVAELEQRRTAELAAEQRDVQKLAEKARTAHRAGKSGTAGVYYRMAIKQARGSLRQQLEAEAAQVAHTAPSSTGKAGLPPTNASKSPPSKSAADKPNVAKSRPPIATAPAR